MWPFKPKSFLGIDVGTASVKLVELSKKGGAISLDTYGEFKSKDYFEYVKKADGITYLKLIDSDIVRIIKELIKETGAKSRYVNFSLPTISTFSTIISLPLIPQKELANAINYEAKQYVPIPLSEAILDWSVINTTPANLEIFIAAFPKELVNSYSRISQMSNLKLKALELETFSLTRSLIYPEKEPDILIDLGATSSNISVINDGFIQFSHNFNVSGAIISRTLATALGIEKSRAEEIKTNQGLFGKEGEKELSKIITPLVDILLNETEKMINLYSRKSGKPIKKIIISGGSANMKGLLEKFSEYFKIETKIGNPFLHINHPALLEETLKEIGPSFAIAVGLAMRELI